MLVYVNAIKMRMSVIIGIAHMSMGICVKGINSVYNGKWIVLIFEVLTGLIILLGLFGWMDFLIIYKWAGYPVNAFSTAPIPFAKLNTDPAVITVMINNFLQLGSQDVYFFPGQKLINVILLIMVFVSVPLMLCVGPCALAYCCKPDHGHAEVHDDFDKIEGEQLIENEEDDGKAEIKAYEKLLNDEAGAEGNHGETFGELFIH